MILTNIEEVPGATIVEHYGLVTGSTVRAKHVGRDILLANTSLSRKRCLQLVVVHDPVMDISIH